MRGDETDEGYAGAIPLVKHVSLGLSYFDALKKVGEEKR